MLHTVFTSIITSATVTAALGFVGKWWFEQFGHTLAAKREFAKKIAEKVAGLGDDNYWPIANAAGTLARELRDYLRSIELHLYIDWDKREDIQERLSQLANEAAEISHASLFKLLKSFQEFHSDKGQTYLLPHHGSGRQLRRLYNRFLSRFPEQEGGGRLIDEILKSPKLPPAIKRRYADWLLYRLADVVVATESIEAFARLFQHELAILYQDWFKDRRDDDDIILPMSSVMRSRWPGLLADGDANTLARARGESDFLGQLGVIGQGVQQGSGSPASPDYQVHSSGIDLPRGSSTAEKAAKVALNQPVTELFRQEQ